MARIGHDELLRETDLETQVCVHSYARSVVEAGLGSLTPLDVAIPEVAASNVAADAAAEPEARRTKGA